MKRDDLVKRELSRTLKELVREKPLMSITVSELAQVAGISRGTFYNHLFDIYDLINWTFEIDVIQPLQNYIRHHTHAWSGITEQCLKKMYEESEFYCQAVQYRGQNSLRDYMRQRNLDSWKLLIDGYLGEDKTFDAEALDFFERFTAQAIANMVIEWAESGMKIPPEKMALMDCVATRGIYGMIDAAN